MKYRSSAKNKVAARMKKVKKTKDGEGSNHSFEEYPSGEFEDFSNIFD